jgi:hypothetical protein
MKEIIEEVFREWNSTFFAFWSIIEGTTEKVLQFIMLLKLIYNRNFVSLNKKCIFWTLQRISARQTLLTDIIFDMEKKYVDLFRAAPYMLMFVLRKDVLFH